LLRKSYIDNYNKKRGNIFTISDSKDLEFIIEHIIYLVREHVSLKDRNFMDKIDMLEQNLLYANEKIAHYEETIKVLTKMNTGMVGYAQQK